MTCALKIFQMLPSICDEMCANRTKAPFKSNQNILAQTNLLLFELPVKRLTCCSEPKSSLHITHGSLSSSLFRYCCLISLQSVSFSLSSSSYVGTRPIFSARVFSLGLWLSSMTNSFSTSSEFFFVVAWFGSRHN